MNYAYQALQFYSRVESMQTKDNAMAMLLWAIVAQLVERLLPTPEVQGSNPVIGKLLYRILNCLRTVKCIEKTKIKKEAVNGPFLTMLLMKRIPLKVSF